MNRKELAQNYHDQGCNCAQSTALAFKDLVDIDEKTLFAILEGFGFGMGNMSGTCGAFSGINAILSLLNSSRDTANLSKADTYKKAAAFNEEFVKRVGDLECCKIKANSKTTCPECINIAVEIFEEYLAKRS